MNKRKGILVLGVHRSGTSALTRVLGLCGASLPVRLLDTIPDENDTGFWEPKGINSIHEELLRSIKSDWDDISEIPQTWFSTPDAKIYRKKLLGELSKEFSDASLFVIKEPRMCRLLPLWLSVMDKFEAEPLIVIPVRNPLEVAASLKSRNGFKQEKSLLLWLQNFLSAERDSRGMKRTFISYDQLLNNWQSVVRKISFDLDIGLTDHDAKIQSEVDEFLTPDLRHHIYHTVDVENSTEIVHWIKQVYQWALDATHNAETDPVLLDSISREFKISSDAYSPIIDQLQNENIQLSQKLAALQPMLEDSKNQLTWLTQTLLSRDKEVDSVKQTLSYRDEEVDSVKQTLSSRDEELNSIKQVLIVRDEELNSIKHVLIVRDEELNSVKQVLITRDEELSSLKLILNNIKN